MEERDQILIDRYMAGEMTEAERSQFEQRKKDDPLFREEVAQYEVAKEAIWADRDEEIIQRFKNLDATLDRKEDKGPSRGYWFLWLGIAVFIVFGLVGWRLNWLRPDASSIISKVIADTMETDHNQSDISDSSKAPVVKEQENKNIEPEKTTEQKKPDMADSNKKGKELFAEYFEPFKDEMMDPSTRGQSDPTPFDKFRQAYWDGRYDEVPALFKNIASSQQANDNYRFQLANALLHNGQTESAIGLLKSVIKNNKSRYLTEAYFYAGLGYLKEGDMENAKKNFEIYIADEKGKRKEIAVQVFNRLK